MQTEEFVARVHDRLPDADRQQARRTSLATMQVLAEALSPEEAEVLAAQLPRELADVVRLTGDEASSHDRDTFLVRVAELAGVEDGSAEEQARAVLETLREAVSNGEKDSGLSGT